MSDPIEFLQRLIRAQRVGEAEIQRLVAAEASLLGCTVETRRYRPTDVPMIEEFASGEAINSAERESVVARLKGTRGGRSVIFFAHPDSEPVSGVDRWRHDPFAGVIDGGRIYGWGAADDLCGVAILIEGLRAAVAAGTGLAGDVILASTPSKRHARGVSALLHEGLRADAAVYLHPAESGAGLQEIKALAPGLLEFRITVEGCAPDTQEISHTAFAHRAVNPVDKLWALHAALRRLDQRRGSTVHHPALEREVGRSTNLLVSQVSAGREGQFSRVAASAVLAGSLSFPPPQPLSAVQAEVAAAVAEASSGDAWLQAHPPRVEWVSGVAGAEVSPDHPLYRLAAQVISQVIGTEPQVNPLHASSDIRNPIIQASIPTIGFGPLAGDLAQNGLHDEWVDIDDYRRSIKVAGAIIRGWCGES